MEQKRQSGPNKFNRLWQDQQTDTKTPRRTIRDWARAAKQTSLALHRQRQPLEFRGPSPQDHWTQQAPDTPTTHAVDTWLRYAAGPSEMRDEHGDGDADGGQPADPVSDLSRSFSIDRQITERRGVSSQGRYRGGLLFGLRCLSWTPGICERSSRDLPQARGLCQPILWRHLCGRCHEMIHNN